MSTSHAVRQALAHGLSFGGRAPRREFWLVHAAAACLGGAPFVVLVTLEALLAPVPGQPAPGFGLVLVIWMVVLLLLAPPLVAVQVRRLHDAGGSGWWWLLLAALGPVALLGLGLLPTRERPRSLPVAAPAAEARATTAAVDVGGEVDAERVQSALGSAGIRHAASAEGVARASFTSDGDGVPLLEVSYSVDSQVLMVRGALATAYGGDHAAAALVQVDRWHRERRWPTGHLRWLQDGTPRFQVMGEVHHSVAGGATDAQLAEVVQGATSSIGLFTLAVHEALVAPGSGPGTPAGEVDLESWLDD